MQLLTQTLEVTTRFSVAESYTFYLNNSVIKFLPSIKKIWRDNQYFIIRNIALVGSTELLLPTLINQNL